MYFCKFAISVRACLMLRGFALSGRGSRGFAAQKMEYVVSNLREAQVRHTTLKQASAVGASKRS